MVRGQIEVPPCNYLLNIYINDPPELSACHNDMAGHEHAYEHGHEYL